VNLTRKTALETTSEFNTEKLHWKQLVKFKQGKTALETTSEFNMENCTGNN
jgi:hypothetical protein